MKLNIFKFKIELARKEMCISELSGKTNIPEATLYSYTNGKRNPGTKSLGRIAKALDVDVTELIQEQIESKRS